MDGSSLDALASLAANTLVAAAVTDAWESTRHGIAVLFGRGKPDKSIERTLDATRSRLLAQQGGGLEAALVDQAGQWAARLADLLGDRPDAEAELRTLVSELRASLQRTGDHSLTAGREIIIKASGGGMAAGVIHGNVGLPSSLQPAPGENQPYDADQPWDIPSASVMADRGGVAVGSVDSLYLMYQRREVPSRPVRLAPRPVLLAGRESLLTRLAAVLSGGDGPWPRIVALHGLGGVGKTSVAVEYVHRHLAEVGLAWQFSAESPAVLAAGFTELAAELGVRELIDARDPVASVHAVLAALPAGWLLLFDSVPDHASVQAFLPPAGRGCVLITSQNALWPPSQAMEVPVLDTATAARFLTARTADGDEPSAGELAQELGGLPLALEQAGAYVQASGSSLAEHLSDFRGRRGYLLTQGKAFGHERTVATTWALAFERLEQQPPSVTGVLRLLACCAPEPFPLMAILRSHGNGSGKPIPEIVAALTPLLSDTSVARHAVAELRRYSLVMPLGNGLVQVHRLVQAATLDQMPGEIARHWRGAVAALVDVAVPADITLPETWPICAVLLPHAQAVLQEGEGLARIADYLGESGSYTAARDLWRQIADARQNAFGPDDPGPSSHVLNSHGGQGPQEIRRRPRRSTPR